MSIVGQIDVAVQTKNDGLGGISPQEYTAIVTAFKAQASAQSLGNMDPAWSAELKALDKKYPNVIAAMRSSGTPSQQYETYVRLQAGVMEVKSGNAQWKPGGGTATPGPAGSLPPTTVQTAPLVYATRAKTLLTGPTALAVMNDASNRFGQGTAVNATLVNKVIANTTFKALPDAKFQMARHAFGHGSSTSNPAFAVHAKQLQGGAFAHNLALARLGEQQVLAPEEGDSPEKKQAYEKKYAEALKQADADLHAQLPELFATPPKNLVFINERNLKGTDPAKSKVAGHEVMHLVLGEVGVPHDEQHQVTARLGWNAKSGVSAEHGKPLINGEDAEFGTR